MGARTSLRPPATRAARLAVHAPELRRRIGELREQQGLSLQAIADVLNAEEVPTPRGGKQWRPSSVQAALGYRRPPPTPPLPPHPARKGPGGPRRTRHTRMDRSRARRTIDHSPRADSHGDLARTIGHDERDLALWRAWGVRADGA